MTYWEYGYGRKIKYGLVISEKENLKNHRGVVWSYFKVVIVEKENIKDGGYETIKLRKCDMRKSITKIDNDLLKEKIKREYIIESI